MLIYRLEEKNGTGVYQSANTFPVIDNYSGNRTKHPAPWDDSLFCSNCDGKFGKTLSGFTSDKWMGKYVFGFSSPAQLLRWFYNFNDLAELEENGIQISVYESNDVIEGNTQVAFWRGEHMLFNPVKVYAPTEFYDLYAKNLTGE